MRKRISILSLLTFLFCSTIIAQTDEVVYSEDFNGWSSIQSEGWAIYTEDSWNYISPGDDAINFFKQSDGEEIMMLITPLWDLNDATLLTFDYKKDAYVDGIVVEVGTMSDPTDPNSFELINVVPIESEIGVWSNVGAECFLSGVDANTYLCFNVKGPWYTYMYIDNVFITDDNVDAAWPSYCTNLTANPGSENALEINVSWTNPDVQADGELLTELSQVQIILDGVLYTSIDNPVIGGEENVIINVNAPGFYNVSLIPVNDAGSGPEVNVNTSWVGLDAPGMPLNVVAVSDQQNVTISWDAPLVGANGGYYDGVVTEYIIQRADGAEFSVNGNETSYLDLIETPGTYNYKVFPFNSTGQGINGTSNTLAFYFNGYLLWEDYWVGVPAMDWNLEGDGESYEWGMSYWDLSGGLIPEMMFNPYSSSTWDGYSRMKSPVVNSAGFESLLLRFDNFHETPISPYTFKVETSSDGTNWNTAWSVEVTEQLPGQVRMVVLSTEDVGSETLHIAFTYEGSSSSCELILIDGIRLYDAPDVDMAALSVSIPEMINPGESIVPVGVIENQAALDADYEAVFRIKDGDVELFSSNQTGTLESGNYQELNFDAWEALEGEFTASLTVTCLGDVDPDDNIKEVEFDVYLYETERNLVIIEEATGTWCGYCPGAAMGIDALVENGWDVAPVAYHGGDDYTTSEGEARNNYYVIGGYPTATFDGVVTSMGGSATQSMYSTYLPIVQERLQTPTPVNVELFTFSIEGNTLTGNVRIESDSPMAGDDVVLHAVITESHIPESWQNQNELNFVERCMLNGSEGYVLDLADMTENIVFNLELSDSWDQSYCQLVVFVQNMTTKEIFNGDMLDFTYADIIDQSKGLAVYPNPVSDILHIPNTMDAIVNIYNTSGQLMYRSYSNQDLHTVNVREFDSGIYLLEVLFDQSRTSVRIVVAN
ncbi:MAG: T9SS type A sorting domain-containing protein [Bacteroidales bacterium]|nr:T9SS type A sorting domain-containing protein [Bacteroidales bacterium]